MRTTIRWLLASYLALLMTSHVVRRLPHETAPTSGLPVIDVSAREGLEESTGTVRLAYREWPAAADDPHGPPILLLHGSPGSSNDFAKLGPALAKDHFVLAPDLPGFGASELDVPDYSIRTHAAYVIELLDRLAIDSVHVVGFSMGGGVALELLGAAPSHVESLTLLSSLGVQELELLGNYHLNHSVHGFQLACAWLMREAVPHFGRLDDAFFGVPYARNFYDTDQRPLRGILEKIEVPTLIIHGERDILVPVAAAREHHRLVPQSRLVIERANHFMVFRGGEELVEPIRGFVTAVEEGRAPTRSDAKSERLAAAGGDFDPAVIPPAEGVTLLVLVALIALATLVTEDLACIATGLLVAQGRIGLFAGTLACFVGIVVGDVLLYWAGRALGRPWLSRAPLRWIVSPEKVQRSTDWFEQRGPAVVFTSRFLPGTRTATYFAAGLLRAGFWRFFSYFVLAVAIWTPILVGISSLIGNRMVEYFSVFQRYALPSVVLALVLLWTLIRVVPLLLTWRGRRHLVGWWGRWRHFEFWPLWLFYTPVVLWIGWLALKHRSPTLFTAANPGIPAGGFIGESKTDILDQLAPASVAPYRRIPARLERTEKLDRVRSFVEQSSAGLPVVLKPDAGQRGTGVVIARSWQQIEEFCAAADEDFLVQEFIEGRELGIFYARLPEEKKGTIFSITDKRIPQVVGDGVSTLERLVLSDRRAVFLAPLYLGILSSRCSEVPVQGEKVALAELGTHCRGAIFLDGAPFWSPQLEARVDEISRSFDGFFFGRFDFKAPSEEAFLAGRGLKILELNGVTSEATHIYDPSNSLLVAYRVLFRQWRLAFEIGRQNCARGVEPATLRELIAALTQYRRSKRAARREELAIQSTINAAEGSGGPNGVS